MLDDSARSGNSKQDQQTRQRRISNISESSDNRRPQKKQQRPPLQVSVFPPPPMASLPPRRISSMSTSDDRPEYKKASSVGRLLEEWPNRDSIFEDDMSIDSTKQEVKEVKFAQYSSIHVYPAHECERKKSYKSPDLKKFKTQVGIDVLRVEELIMTCPYKRGNAVCHLIDTGALTPEELIGIDHLLCGEDAAKTIAFDRFSHAKLITRKQLELHEHDLAAFAKKKSSKNVEKALMRARLAELQAKQDDTIGQIRCSPSPPAA
jgi:hypothetical protein